MCCGNTSRRSSSFSSFNRFESHHRRNRFDPCCTISQTAAIEQRFTPILQNAFNSKDSCCKEKIRGKVFRAIPPMKPFNSNPCCKQNAALAFLR